MAATYQLRQHLRSMELAGRPEAIAERKIAREASSLALAECRAKFPQLSAENFETADRYRRERVSFWTENLTE